MCDEDIGRWIGRQVSSQVGVLCLFDLRCDELVMGIGGRPAGLKYGATAWVFFGFFF